MASQAPFFSTLIPIIHKKNHAFSPNFSKFKNSKAPFSKTQEPEPEQDPIKLAFAKAKSYKTSLQSNTEPNSVDDSKQIPMAVKLAMEKAKEYKKNKANIVQDSVKIEKLKFDETVKNDSVEKAKESVEVSLENETLKSDEVIENGSVEKEVTLGMKLALEKAKEYKKNKGVAGVGESSVLGVKGGNERTYEEKEPAKNKGLSNSGIDFADEKSLENEPNVVDDSKELPLAVKLAMEKAKEYKKNKAIVGNEVSGSNIVKESVEVSLKDEKLKSGEVIENGSVEKEVPLTMKIALEKAKEYRKNKGVVGVGESSVSGVKGGNERNYEEKEPAKNKGLSISGIDFVGLNFSDKKTGRGLPAGLVPFSDSFPGGDLPEVEILVGDKSKFGNTEESSDQISVKENDLDDELYKPKVTTWGLFPRPNDISKAYGGGRTLRPGEALETAEEKAAKEAKTKKLLAAYKKKFGLNIDPKLKSECEQALNEGDSLMDLGRLKEALPFYEKVMENLPLQSELHGLAALQWSICLDSLNRSNEARVMYEKLQSHPIPRVSKRARQFVFGFQAMEMMKVTTSPRTNPFTGYQNYFNAFVKDTTDFTLKEAEADDETGLSQTLPYVVFLLSPILLVFLIATFRSR